VDPRRNPKRQGAIMKLDSCVEEGTQLRRLEEAASQSRLTGESAAGIGKAPTDRTSFAWRGMRQSPRIRCSGSVEFRTEGSDEHLWGTLTDISLHGCYVEMSDTFPVDTNVYLVLKSFGLRIQTQGTVRTSFPSKGMGIGFTEIEPGQQTQLNQLLDALTGGKSASTSASPGDKGDLGSVDPIALVDEIKEFFRKKQLLSREEFHQIAKRVRRP
jgi:PilZ domain